MRSRAVGPGALSGSDDFPQRDPAVAVQAHHAQWLRTNWADAEIWAAGLTVGGAYVRRLMPQHQALVLVPSIVGEGWTRKTYLPRSEQSP